MTQPLLFTPKTVRGLTLRNRIVLAPMCQYSATDGFANDWHMVHLGKFAMGRFGAIMTEAAAVQESGRITHGDLGLWSDAHADALRPVASFVRGQGSAFGIQLAHAGRKASMQRPWFGNAALGEEDFARGDHPWPIKGASEIPLEDGWLTPREMTVAEIKALTDDFAAAARRAIDIGCDFLEVHGAHGYLIQSFLSPASNKRGDAYGGDRAGRMRIALEVTEAVRAAMPDDKPLFFRISSVDGFEGGWTIEDSVALARELKTLGVDIVDCSSGGNAGRTAAASGRTMPRGFQAGYAEQVRREAEVETAAVGMIIDGPQAEAILQSGQADLVAVAREALYNPFWPVHEAKAMAAGDFSDWPTPFGWWLERREPSMVAIREQEGQA